MDPPTSKKIKVESPWEPTPGMLLHAAIEKNDWPTAQTVLAAYGAIAGTAKNPRGTTPLMLAADGKCGRNNSLLMEALLEEGNGGASTAAERNKKGKTGAYLHRVVLLKYALD